MFPAEGASPEFRDVQMSVNVAGHGCTNDITLFRQQNPYMLDGPTSWLSADLREFALRPGESLDRMHRQTLMSDGFAPCGPYLRSEDNLATENSAESAL